MDDRARHVWVYVEVTRDGDEWILGCTDPGSHRVYPMVTSRARLLGRLDDAAVSHAARTGHVVELRRFSGPFEVVRIFEPGGG